MIIWHTVEFEAIARGMRYTEYLNFHSMRKKVDVALLSKPLCGAAYALLQEVFRLEKGESLDNKGKTQ